MAIGGAPLINLMRKSIAIKLLVAISKISILLLFIVSVSFIYYGKKRKSQNDIVYKAISVYEMAQPLEFARRTETKAFEFSIYAEVDKNYFKSRSSVETAVLAQLNKKDGSVLEKKVEIKFRVNDLGYEYSHKMVKSKNQKITLGPKRFFVYDEDLLNVESVTLVSLSSEAVNLFARPFSVRINAKHESDKSWARLKPESKEEFEALSIVPDGSEKHKERLNYAITQKNSISPEGATNKKKIEIAQKDNFDAKNYVFVGKKKHIWFSLEQDSIIRITPSVYSKNRSAILKRLKDDRPALKQNIMYNASIKLEKGVYSVEAVSDPAFIHILKEQGENLASPFVTTKFYFSDEKEITYKFSDKNYPLSRLRVSFPSAPSLCSLKIVAGTDNALTKKEIQLKPIVNNSLRYKTFYKVNLSYENILYFNQKISSLKVSSDCSFVARVEESLSDRASNLFSFSKWQEVKPVNFSQWPTEFLTYQVVERESKNKFNYSSFYALKSQEQGEARYIINTAELSEDEKLSANNFIKWSPSRPVSKDMRFFLSQCSINKLDLNSERIYKLEDFEELPLNEVRKICEIYVTTTKQPGYKLSKFESMGQSLSYVYSFDSLYHRVKVKILVPVSIRNYPLKLKFSYNNQVSGDSFISFKPHRGQRNFIISQEQLLPYNEKYNYIETILPYGMPIKPAGDVELVINRYTSGEPLLIRSVFNGDYATDYELKAWRQIDSGQRSIDIKEIESRHKAETFKIEDLFDDIIF